MVRQKKESVEMRLARLLRDAYLGVYVRDNPLHTAPGWEELRSVNQSVWVKVATLLLEKGVSLP